MLISFSGLDGAGKTTHIGLTARYLEQRGHRIRILRMYDHVSVSALLRKRLWRRLRSRSEISSKNLREESEVAKRKVDRIAYRHDKNRKGFWIVLMRQIVYVFDAMVFFVVKTYHEKLHGRAVICDRHLIDSIVNLANTNRFAESYARGLLAVVPKPDLPILLDVDAEVAFGRKPEYPLSYNQERRRAYLDVFSQLKNGAIIPSSTIEEVQAEIERRLAPLASNRERPERSSNAD